MRDNKKMVDTADDDLVGPEQPGEAWPLPIEYAIPEITFPKHPGAVMMRRVPAPARRYPSATASAARAVGRS